MDMTRQLSSCQVRGGRGGLERVFKIRRGGFERVFRIRRN
jgi:hypothetical protein